MAGDGVSARRDGAVRDGGSGDGGGGAFERVLVAHRANQFRPGPAVLRNGLLISDLHSPRRHGGPRRLFWLLDEQVQLVWEAFHWHKEWYVDIVSVEETRISRGRRLFTVTDRYVDVVVEGMGPTYRMLDLDEAAEALQVGNLTVDELAAAITSAQRFVDRYLHGGAVFPPPRLAPWFDADHDYPEID